MKIMISSMKMSGLSDEQVSFERQKKADKLTAEDFDVVKTSDISDGTNPLEYLAESLKCMAKCDAVYFPKGFGSTKESMIEWWCATNYGKMCICEGEDGTWHD